MKSPSPRPTCFAENGSDLVTYEHNDRVLDPSLHYFGCLKASQRDEFFTQLPRTSQRKIVEERCRIRRIRAFVEANPTSDAGAIFKEFKHGAKDWYRHDRKLEVDEDQYSPQKDGSHTSVEEDIMAGMTFFKNGRPHTVPGLDDKFPNQKISVQQLLADDPDMNPLMQQCESGTLRYFHLPANNMVWVEEAIARYYHEERPNPEDCFQNSTLQQRSKYQMLLRQESWLGQQHGDGNAEVYARHMRPLCDVIPANLTDMEAPNNLALFMHYLHWETDRGRNRSANAIKEASKPRVPTTLAEVVDEATADERPSTTTDPNRPPTALDPPIKRRRGLARMLFHAAKLAEAMNSHSDERLISEYLYEDPALHPRRTLDQSYYGALFPTQTRDRDQVVYRATAPQYHRCVRENQERKCARCQEDVQMAPRVIMVDQLWMWILDENTIITAFPEQWGRNRQDSSAVHQSIRTRFAIALDGEVRSVFDLALIIVDQCSRVFFDRSKPINQAPKLVDIFADAIRGVTYKQAAAFDQFLTYTHLASKNYNANDKSGDAAMENALLNINPEGNLLKEVKDILDELHIMTRIQLQQQAVAESFVGHIKQILQPKIAGPADSWLDMLNGAGTSDSEEAEAMHRQNFQDAKRTVTRADALLKGIQDRIAELKTLEDAASNTSAALKDLLTLKQQQAGVIEAREAVKQATETLKQGRSIMLFTVVTIVFLPLGFCATVFGMNTAEFNDGHLTLHEEFYYMFPISIAIILTSFLLAFSSSPFLSSLFSLIWAGLSYPINVGFTWALTKSGIFMMSRRLVGKAKLLRDKEKKRTAVMMAEAMREKMDLGSKIEGWKGSGVEGIDGVKSGVKSGMGKGLKITSRGRLGGKGGMKVDVESLASGDV